MQLQEAVDEATDTMRAASQALTLMEGTAAEEELCGLLARALSHEADRLAKKAARMR
jgi:peptide deformylase